MRSLFSILIAFLPLSCYRAQVPTPPQPGVPHLKIMTFHVAGTQEAALIRILRQADCDLVLLQGIDQTTEKLIRTYSPLSHMAFQHHPNGGFALLSRFAVHHHQILPAQMGSFFPAWLTVIEAPLGHLQILQLQLQPPLRTGPWIDGLHLSNTSKRLEEIKHYTAQLDPHQPILIAGTFYENRGGAIFSFLDKQGMQSGLPLFDPSQPTYRRRYFSGIYQAQVDHLVFNTKLRALSVEVMHTHSVSESFHLPVIGTFVRH